MRYIIYNNKIMLTMIAVFFFSVCIIGSVRLVRADESIQYNKSFQSIEIRNGDTLISIAKEYALSEADYASYIAEVKNMNSLSNDTIHAGCYLLIPVYEIIP